MKVMAILAFLEVADCTVPLQPAKGPDSTSTTSPFWILGLAGIVRVRMTSSSSTWPRTLCLVVREQR